MPLFSVIVPMYNVEKYAKQCIESILNQSFCDFELILVDDGAKDSTPQIIDEYAKKDDRVKVIHKKNGGVNSTRKAGCKVATGEYIMLVDGDDWMHPDCLQKFAEAIKEHPTTQLFLSGCYYAADNGEIIERKAYGMDGLLSEEFIKQFIRPHFSSFPKSVWAKAYKRELYVKFQDRVEDCITVGEDLSIIVPMLYEIDSIYILNDFLYFYRYNPGSITKNKKKEWPTEGLLARVKVLEESLDLTKYNLDNQLTAYVAHATINQCLSYFKANAYFVARKKSKELLDNNLIKKYINKNVKVADKKERLAKFALKKRFYLLMKLYTYFW